MNVLVADGVGQPDEGVGGVGRHPLGVGRDRQPRGGAGHDTRRAHPLGDDVGTQEVLLHEGAQRLAELVLARGDDRGVGNRDAQGVAKERGDREPVGQAPDHGGLGAGAQVADPTGVAAGQGDGDPHRGHEHEHSRRPSLHECQLFLPLLLGAHGRGSGGRHSDRIASIDVIGRAAASSGGSGRVWRSPSRPVVRVSAT